jgi:hypothetical protein
MDKLNIKLLTFGNPKHRKLTLVETLRKECSFHCDEINPSENMPSKVVEWSRSCPLEHMGTKRHPKHERSRKRFNSGKAFLDVAELIRSIQRAEGNPDCFRRARGHCDRPDCAWRRYCLEKLQGVPHDQSKAHKMKNSDHGEGG